MSLKTFITLFAYLVPIIGLILKYFSGDFNPTPEELEAIAKNPVPPSEIFELKGENDVTKFVVKNGEVYTQKKYLNKFIFPKYGPPVFVFSILMWLIKPF